MQITVLMYAHKKLAAIHGQLVSSLSRLYRVSIAVFGDPDTIFRGGPGVILACAGSAYAVVESQPLSSNYFCFLGWERGEMHHAP